MANKKINDLATAPVVSDGMQFETDIGGVVSNKVDAIKIKTYAIGASNLLVDKGTISLPSQFPTTTDVKVGWLYRFTADVIDNDPSKTNTLQSFINGDQAYWNGSNWTILGKYEAILAQSNAESYADAKFLSKGSYTLGYIPVANSTGSLTAIDGIISGTNINIGTNVTTGAKTINSPAFESNTANIKMDGSVNVGSLSTIARADHIHPSDTSKESTLTKGNLSTSTTGVTIGSGTNAVIGSGTTVNIQNATSGQNGLLTSTDWSYFNGKEPAITGGTTSQYWRGDKTWQTLPTFGDDVVYHDTRGDFPATGTAGIIYISRETWLSYSWNGAAYARLSDVVTAATAGNFPVVGELKVIYIATTTNALYYWNGVAYDSLTQGANPIQPKCVYARKGGDDSKTGQNNDDQAVLNIYIASQKAAALYAANNPVAVVCLDGGLYSNDDFECRTNIPVFIPNAIVDNFGSIVLRANSIFVLHKLINGSAAPGGVESLHKVANGNAHVSIRYWQHGSILNDGQFFRADNNTGTSYLKGDSLICNNASDTLINIGANNTLFLNYQYIKGSIPSASGATVHIKCQYYNGNITAESGETIYIDSEVYNGTVTGAASSTIYINCPNRQNLTIVKNGGTIYINEALYNSNVVFVAKNGDNNFCGLIINQPLATIDAAETYINSLSPAPSATNRWSINSLDDSLYPVGNGLLLKDYVDLNISNFSGANLTLWNSNIVNLETFTGLGTGADISIYNYPSVSSTRYFNCKYIKNAGVSVDLNQGTSYLNFNLFETGTSSIAISCKANSTLVCTGNKITAGSITANGTNAIIDLTYVKDIGSCTFSAINGGVILYPMTSYYTNFILKAANGGTGQSTSAIGDLLVGNGAGGWDKLTKGGDGKLLSSNSLFTYDVDWVSLGSNVNTISLPTSRLSTAVANNTFTPSFTLTNGTNRIVLLAIGTDEAINPEFYDVKYGGVAMRHLPAFYQAWENNCLDFWYLLESDLAGLGVNTSNAATISFINPPSSISKIGYNFAVYDNVNQFTPFKSFSKNNNQSAYTIASTIADCSIGDHVVSFGYSDWGIGESGAPVITVNSNFTRRNNVGFSSSQLAIADYVATSTSHSVTWIMTSSYPGMATIGFALRRY